MRIDERDIVIRYVHASGPGGQHVNKTATAAQLRFDLNACATLPEHVKEAIRRNERSRINNEGVLIIDARRCKSRERNREDALQRLDRIVKKAAHRPKPRKATAPTRASKERRLAEKKRRGEKKGMRRKLRNPDDT